MSEAGIDEPLRFTAALTDGDDLWRIAGPATASRPPSISAKPPTAFSWCPSRSTTGPGLAEVPKGCALVARAGTRVAVECLNEAMSRLAA